MTLITSKHCVLVLLWLSKKRVFFNSQTDIVNSFFLYNLLFCSKKELLLTTKSFSVVQFKENILNFQGISTVLETGIGAPDPEELARRAKDNESKPQPNRSEDTGKTEADPNAGDAFQLGSLLSGVTKFVENTGMFCEKMDDRPVHQC